METEYIQTIDNLDCILPIAKDTITSYCIENQIEDEKKIHPNTWNDILDEICQRVFVNNPRILKTESCNHNQYDKDKVLYIYNRVYKKLCNIYVQEICQQGFITLCGIDKQTLYNWSNGTPSSPPFDLQEKIREDNEESVWGLMRGDAGNPNKYFGKLNKYHGWNGSGTTSTGAMKQAISLEDLRGKIGALGVQKAVEVLQDSTGNAN